MKKTLLAAAFATALMATPAVAKEPVIGLAMAQLDTFLTIMKNGALKQAKADGATIQIEDAQGDISKQLDQINNLIAKKVDAIIVNPVDADATPNITKMITAAGIPLVYVNRRPSDFDKLPAGVAFVASDEKISGTIQTQEVCRLLNGKGNIGVLMGDLSTDAARTRTKDIEEVLATKECSGIKILDKREGKWQIPNAQDIVTNWISSGMKFDAIIANNDDMALGAINALKATNKWTKDYIVAGIDATPTALQSMKKGEMKVTVFQNADGQGTGAVKAALKLAKKEPVERFVNIPFELVVPSNLDKYMGK